MEIITLKNGWAPAPIHAVVADHLVRETTTYTPQPVGDQILVRMQLIPIHSLDMLHCAGFLGGPRAGGCEALGVIAGLGDGATGFSVGERVLVLAWPVLGEAERIFDLGARISLWSEYVLTTAEH